MIENVSINAFLRQIPLSVILEHARDYTVAQTNEDYALRADECGYELANFIVENKLATVSSSNEMIVMASLESADIYIDTNPGKPIYDFDLWKDKLKIMTYKDFMSVSKKVVKQLIATESACSSKMIDSIKRTRAKSDDELYSVTECVDDIIFDDECIAMEDAITDGLKELDSMSSSGGGDSGGGDNSGGGGEVADVAGATQEKMDEDSGGDDPFASDSGADDPFASDNDSLGDDSGGGDGGGDTGGGDKDEQATEEDPLKSIEIKKTYKARFVKLYDIISDSLTSMENFTPAYTTKISSRYYELQMQLRNLQKAIYNICVDRISKMGIPEVLRSYMIANHIFDVITHFLEDFFEDYNKEMEKNAK